MSLDSTVQSRRASRMTSHDHEAASKARPSVRHSPQNPLSDQDQLSTFQELRRQKYLIKVGQASKEKQWLRRSDLVEDLLFHRSIHRLTCIQILHQQFFEQKKAWEQEKAKAAPDNGFPWDDQNRDEVAISSGTNLEKQSVN